MYKKGSRTFTSIVYSQRSLRTFARPDVAAATARPRLPRHSLARPARQGVINDLMTIDAGGILVRSHRPGREDFIDAARFEIWWEHLVARGSASLYPGDENNPHRWLSSVVGAILLAGPPNRLRLVHGDTLELLGQGNGLSVVEEHHDDH
jgi:hypothetical protein